MSLELNDPLKLFRGKAPDSDRPTSTHLHLLSIITKQPYTWTHIVNSIVCVGLLCDDTPHSKCQAGLKLGGRSLELFP